MRNIVPLIIMSIMLASCSEGAESLDNGLMVRDGVELHLSHVSQIIRIEGTLDHTVIVPLAVSWWNQQMGFELFEQTTRGDADISVEQGYVHVSDDADELDSTAISFDMISGDIEDVNIVLSSDHAYDRPTMLQTLKHAMGHSLGLDDDPGPPVTVDLMSIMSSPLDPLGKLTQHDRAILWETIIDASQ